MSRKKKSGKSVGETSVEQADLDKMPHQDNPSEDGSQDGQDMPVKTDHTNAQSAMENYNDAGGSGGVSPANAASEGKTIPDKTLEGETEDEKLVAEKTDDKDETGLEQAQRKLGATDAEIAAQKAYDDGTKDGAEHPQVSRTYDGEMDVAAIQKRRNAERAYKQAGIEIPENTGYVFLDNRPKQTNLGAGEEVSQGQVTTEEVIKKEDANVENR